MVATGEALENTIDGRLALCAADFVVTRLAPQQTQDCQEQANPLAVVKVLQKHAKRQKLGG